MPAPFVAATILAARSSPVTITSELAVSGCPRIQWNSRHFIQSVARAPLFMVGNGFDATYPTAAWYKNRRCCNNATFPGSLSPQGHIDPGETLSSFLRNEPWVPNFELWVSMVDASVVSQDDLLSARAFRVETRIIEHEPVASSRLLWRWWPCRNLKLWWLRGREEGR